MVGKKAFKSKLLIYVCALVIGIMALPVTAYALDSEDTYSLLEWNIYDTQAVADLVYSGYWQKEGTTYNFDNCYTYSGKFSLFSELYIPQDENAGFIVLYNYMYRDITLTRFTQASGVISYSKPTITIDNVTFPDGVTYTLKEISSSDGEYVYRLYLYFNECSIPTWSGANITFNINQTIIAENAYFGSSYAYLGYNVSFGDYVNCTTSYDEDYLYGKTENAIYGLGDFIIDKLSDLKSALLGSLGIVQGEISSSSEKETVIIEQESQKEQALQNKANDLQEEANETSMNIFEKITDFFDNFFSRLGDFLLGLIVPSSEDLTAFLDEVNDWFSARLGFIWYPFSLALDIVSAFAGGTADTMFKVPGLTLNILGGEHTIWNPIEVDLDAFGIFKYVRMFTSFLLVAGVVKLAYDKWDEWIGGHGVG